MDLKRWIYSPDIARWLSVGREMELAEWVDCILSAPHRTLEEKLEGLRELRREVGEGQRPEGGGQGASRRYAGDEEDLRHLDKKIEMVGTLDEILHMAGGLNNLYEADIFYQGRRDSDVERKIFTVPQPGIRFIQEQIKKTADRVGCDRTSFFGVLRKFRRRGGRHMDLEWDILLDPEGKVLYCLPETVEAVEKGEYQIGPSDYHYLKLPYPSGTVVETIPSPFFPAIKGVLVDRIEPWEEGFAQDDEQWLIYPEPPHGSRDAGIGAILLDHYASLTFGEEFVLPFVQFFRRYEGALLESEQWLHALGELIRKDKSCFALLLRDRRPEKCPGEEADIRRDYVRELEERCRNRETKRLAEELALSRTHQVIGGEDG